MRYDPNEPQTTTYDPELGIWSYAEPLPYDDQEPPKHPVLAWVALHTVLRRYRCHGSWLCAWAAAEEGDVCDRHGAKP